MRTPARQTGATTKARVARAASVPAPVGGWDAQSPLADMPEKNAVILDNLIPRPGYVEMRRGFVPQQVGFGAPIESMLVWRGPTGDKLLAAGGANIWNASAQFDVPGTPLWTGSTSARYRHVNFANDAGQFVIAVNGADAPIRYDGSTVAALSLTYAGTVSFDQTRLFAVALHKRRLHFAQKNSLRVWFLDTVNAIQGAVGLLDLGPVFSKGGTLACMATWSLNFGTGLDDFIAYMSSQGQVAIYQGTDPGDATAWSLVGVYDLGYPLGTDALLKYGSDLAVLTSDGVIPLSQALQLDRAKDNSVALTQRIQRAFQNAAASYKGLYGWQGFLYPKGSLAIFNVPTAELTGAVQFVQNVQTGAWCRFTGLNAVCWALANDNAYFAQGTGIYQWDTTASDLGTPIVADLKTAFTDFGARPAQKYFTMARPLIYAPGVVAPALEIDTDYQESTPTATPTVVNPDSLDPQTRYDWATVSGIGYTAAIRMRIALQGGQVSFLDVDGAGTTLDDGSGAQLLTEDPVPAGAVVQVNGFDVMFEPGGLL